MLIDDIDFAELYRQQLRFAGRTEKSPAHWDARAEKMSISCSDPADSYLVQLLAKIDLTGAMIMLIDDIDFAELYRQQLRFAGRTEKSPAHWDARAEKMSISCSDPADSYLVQLLAKIDLTGA
ncbi:hypothetical protein UA70_02040, partial [Raoultella planticola]